MTPLRTRDLFFVSVAAPLAAVAAYVWLWRADAGKRLERLETECRSLVATEEYDDAKAAALRRLDEARRDLEEEKKAKMPESAVVCVPGRPEAMRENDVLRIFGETGLNVLKSESCIGSTAGDVLSAASGISSPVCRKYAIEGQYPAIKRALDLFSSRKAPVIPERIEMRPARPPVWTIWIWQ